MKPLLIPAVFNLVLLTHIGTSSAQVGWAVIREDETNLQLMNPPIPAGDHLKLIKKYQETQRVPPNDPLLGRSHQIGEVFTLITTKGAVDLKLTGFEVHHGAGADYFGLILEGSRQYKDLDALVFKKGVLSAPEKMSLHRPNDLELSSPETKPFFETLRQELLRQATSAQEKRTLQGVRFTKDNLTAARGRFAGKAYALVALHIMVNDMEYLSALFFVDKTGKIISFVEKLHQRLDEFGVEYFVDYDRDGFDEILFHSQYYEGGYVLLLHWKSRQYRSKVLWGDGA
jgi:hypothetical protein